MRAVGPLLGAALVGLALCGPAGAGVARAQGTPADSLGRFLHGLADSTDRYFGISAARPDTTGLDSALAWALANPSRYRPRSRLSATPTFAFDRADGPVWGGAAELGVYPIGVFHGGGRYAAGPNDWLWDAGWRRGFEGPSARWRAHVRGMNATDVVDRERGMSRLATVRALVYGSDSRHYYRRAGVEVGLQREATTWRAGVTYRDMVDRPLVTTTGWNLAHQALTTFENLPAARGRAREFTIAAAWRMPFVPVTAEIEHATSGTAIGSDFEYRRTRVSASGEFAIGRFAALVPQALYGRVADRLIPQAAFYMGGSHTLRSIETSSLGGAGLALARLDLIGAPDLLELAHLPHPAMFPVQGALFAATGAVWGDDPYGGPPRPGGDWPRRQAWLSEVGVSAIWQPGIPDPDHYFRIDYAIPLGPAHPEVTHWTVSYTRALDLVRPFQPHQ